MHNEPNLTHEGLDAANVNGSWKDGAEFADFFIEVQRLLKLRFGSHIKIGFPGLSPGADTFYQVGPDSGFRMDSKRFLADAAPAVAAADFVGLHAYFANMDEVHSGAMRLVRISQTIPDKLLFVTEYSNPLTQVPSAEKGRQNKEFLRLISDIRVSALLYYFLYPATDGSIRRCAAPAPNRQAFLRRWWGDCHLRTRFASDSHLDDALTGKECFEIRLGNAVKRCQSCGLSSRRIRWQR